MTVTLTDQNFNEKVKDGIVLVDFWAPWCGPCRLLGPVIDELAEEFAGQITIGKLNVDDNPHVANHFGIMSIPTMILFQDGKAIEKIQGFQPKPILSQYLQSKLD